jgi:hypothetical protein
MAEMPGYVPVGTARFNLLIADCFMGELPPECTEIEVETQADNRQSAFWYVSLQGDRLSTFVYHDVGYWVRQGILFTQEQNAYIPCHIGFSPESGKLLKLLGRSSRSDLSVWMESGPVSHLLYIGTMA